MQLFARGRRLRLWKLGAVSLSVPLFACAQNDGSVPPSHSLVQLGINQRVSCTVTHVSDGDSIVCAPLGRVRLLLIDSPEMSDRERGREAKKALLDIMPVGTKVTAETDVRVTDQFGRVLAYLFLPDGEMVNERMAESGYATTLVYPPNVKYVERIRAAVKHARDEKRGLWENGGFECPPRDYRAGRCR